MQYRFDQIGDITKISLEGRLVAGHTDAFREAAIAGINNCPNLLLDLQAMEHIDSSGLGALVSLLQKATAAGGSVKLACLQPRPKIVFDITRVYRVFEIYDSVDAAIASFHKGTAES